MSRQSIQEQRNLCERRRNSLERDSIDFSASVGAPESHHPPFNPRTHALRAIPFPCPLPSPVCVHVSRHLSLIEVVCNSATRKTRRAIPYVGAISNDDEAKPVHLAPFVRTVHSLSALLENRGDRGRPITRGATWRNVHISEESKIFDRPHFFFPLR